MSETSPPTGKSSTGLEENVAGLLAYLFGFISGIIFLVMEKSSSTVRFHALQSIFFCGAMFILNMVLGFIPVVNLIAYIIIGPLSIIIWIVLMMKAYQGKVWKLPVIGDIAENNAKIGG